MNRVIFLRHGLTKENQEERIQGQLPGTLLVPETEAYLTAIIPLIRTYNPTMLISSDLVRAVETRHILSSFLKIPTIKEESLPLLRERSMGSLEGQLWNEVAPSIAAHRNSPLYDFQPYGGESSDDVRGRVLATLWYFAENYRHERLCVITHAGWLHQLASIGPHAHHLPQEWMNRTAIYEASLSPVGHLESLTPLPIYATLGN